MAIELQCLIDLDVEIELTLEEAREADGASRLFVSANVPGTG